MLAVSTGWMGGVSVAALQAQAGGTQQTRIAPVPEGQRSPEQQKAAATFTAADMPNMAAAYLHHPALVQRMLPHVRYLNTESTLPPRHRFLLSLRTAWLTRSNYLWAHRAPAARQAGFTDADFRRIAQGADAPGWDPFEATLVRTADELHEDSFISDASWKTLSARYDVNQMIDTIDTVGAFTMHAGMLNSMGVPIEAAMKERLPNDAPYAVAAKRTNIRLEGKGARIPPVEAQPGARGGGGANVFRTFVRNPPADRVRGAINTHVNSSSTLTPRHRELLLMRIGVLCRSEYEFAAHARVGRNLGMTEADVARIVAGPDSPGGDPIEALLMRATDEVWEDDVVSAKTWSALASTLDTRQMIDMLVAIGGYRSTSMLINSAGVQLDANMADFRFPPALR
jgi:alkylhydroperoxidase family enzyme